MPGPGDGRQPAVVVQVGFVSGLEQADRRRAARRRWRNDRFLLEILEEEAQRRCGPAMHTARAVFVAAGRPRRRQVGDRPRISGGGGAIGRARRASTTDRGWSPAHTPAPTGPRRTRRDAIRAATPRRRCTAASSFKYRSSMSLSFLAKTGAGEETLIMPTSQETTRHPAPSRQRLPNTRSA